MSVKWFSGESATNTGANQISNSVFKGKHLDADYETSVEHTVREIIQNSLDAKPGRKLLTESVEIEISTETLSADAFPETPSLDKRLDEIEHYYNARESAQKEKIKTLVQKVRKVTRALGSVTICRFSDFETTGIDCLEPEDGVDRSKFVEFATTIGGSEKDPSLSGQNGFGRLAPFASSGCRTVIYSTHFNENQSFGTIGMAMLAGTKGPDRLGVDSNCYLGDFKERLLSPITQLISPFAHKKRKDKPGLDVAIIDINLSQFTDLVVPSILINFWLAIQNSYLDIKTPWGNLNSTELESAFIKQLRILERKQQELHKILLTQYRLYLIHKNIKPFVINNFKKPVPGDQYLDQVTVWGDRLPTADARDVDTGLFSFNERGMLIGRINNLVLKTQTFLGLIRPTGTAAGEVLRMAEDPSHTSYSVDHLAQRLEENGLSGDPKALIKDFKSVVAATIREQFTSATDEMFSIELEDFYEPLDFDPSDGDESDEADIESIQEVDIDQATINKLKTKQKLKQGGRKDEGSERKKRKKRRFERKTDEDGTEPVTDGKEVIIARCFLAGGGQSYWAQNLEGKVTGVSLLIVDDSGQWIIRPIDRALVNGMDIQGDAKGKITLNSEPISEIEVFPADFDPTSYPRAVKFRLECERVEA